MPHRLCSRVNTTTTPRQAHRWVHTCLSLSHVDRSFLRALLLLGLYFTLQFHSLFFSHLFKDGQPCRCIPWTSTRALLFSIENISTLKT